MTSQDWFSQRARWLWIMALFLGLLVSLTGAPRRRVTQRSASAPQGSRAPALPPSRPSQAPSSQASSPRILESYGKLPLSFEVNQGQSDPSVEFLARGSGYALFLTSGEAVLSLRRPQETPSTPSTPMGMTVRQRADARFRNTGKTSETVLRMRLVGGNPAAHVEGLAEIAGKSNYFIGENPKKWQTNVPHFGKVQYKDVYPGVDLVYYGNQQQLEYDFIVAPGVDPRTIRLAIAGAEKFATGAGGDLVLHTAEGEVRLRKPVVYQQVGGVRTEIAGRYVLRGKRQIGFEVAAYDTGKPLIIDPVLSYSTYLGGSSFDEARSIAVDDSGNAYVTGFTASLNFPTKNPLQSALGKSAPGSTFIDAFVTKLDPTGSTLIYSTYLGGSGGDAGFAIAVDRSGNAYVTGFTDSTDFPTKNPLQPARSGFRDDAFVAKLDPTGSALVYSTYLGGSGSDVANGIAVDTAGNAYVTGFTDSTDFPTKNPFQAALGGGRADAFVTKLDSTGSALVYSTYLGGSDFDEARGIAVDGSGNAYVTGSTDSLNFPTKNPFQAGSGGNGDTFVAKLDATGSALIYSTYLGGSGFDEASGIAVDGSGNAYVTGRTFSLNFPTKNPFQAASGGNSDTFVAKLDATGSALIYSTYLGGSAFDEASGIAVDGSGNAYVTGGTNSTFPTKNPLQVSGASFVAVLDSTGSALIYSTYFGSSFFSETSGIAVDGSGNAYVTGTANSNFLVTPGAFQTSPGSNGIADAFVAKISPSDSPGFSLTSFSVTFPDEGIGGTTAAQTITLANTGSAALTIASIVLSGGDFPETNTCGSSLAGGTSCAISVTFTPTAAGVRTGTITITDSAASSPQKITLTGSGIAGLSSTLTPPSLSFGNQTLGTTSAPQAITLNNTGSATLTINDFSIVGACDFEDVCEFSTTFPTTCGASLAVGASCTFDIVFTPLAVGNRSATLQILDNSAQSPRTVTLTGVGIPAPPDFSISPGSSTFATVTAGQSATYSVSVVGTGGFSGTVSLTCADPVPQSTCSVSPASQTVGATPVSSTVTVTTTARSSVPLLWHPPTSSPGLRFVLPWLLLFLSLVMLANALRARAFRRYSWTGLATMLMATALFSGCGGGSQQPTQSVGQGTAAGTYQIILSGTSAGVTHTTPLSITVR